MDLSQSATIDPDYLDTSSQTGIEDYICCICQLIPYPETALEEENIFETKKSGMSGGPGSSNNAINSPFGYAQNKNQKMSSTNNQKSNKKNLTQRYAIGYQNNK